MPYIESEKVDAKTRVKLEALIEKSYLSYWRKTFRYIFCDYYFARISSFDDNNSDCYMY